VSGAQMNGTYSQIAVGFAPRRRAAPVSRRSSSFFSSSCPLNDRENDRESGINHASGCRRRLKSTQT
jgi:hypothetical protein